MSGETFMRKLLNGAEVEWLPLGEVTQYEQPTRHLVLTKNYGDTYKTPVLTAGKTFILGYTDETDGIKKASSTPVIIFDDFTTANKWVDFDFKAKSSAMKIISSSDDKRFLLKYVYYWMSTLRSDFVEGDHKRHWIRNYRNKKLPLPCPDDSKKSMAIQSEIVRILDIFAKLTSELTAELKAERIAREKQFRYYRKKILTFDDVAVKWIPLGELATIGTGSRNTNEASYDGKFPFFVRSQRPRKIDSFEFDETAIITAGDGDVGKVFHYIKGKYSLHQRAYRIVVKDNRLNPKFLFYFFKSNFHQYIVRKSAHATVASLRMPMFETYSVPIPYPDNTEKSLDEQARIVGILDRFDSQINSISEALPREIELRHKQYEYYLDLLLKFSRHKD